MGFVKCYDIAKMVIDEATKRFGTGYCVNDVNVSSLKARCELVDRLAKRFNGTSYEVDVDEENTDITISLTCDEFEIGNPKDDFYKITAQAKQVNIKPCSPDSSQVQLDFVFDGIWEPFMF